MTEVTTTDGTTRRLVVCVAGTTGSGGESCRCGAEPGFDEVFEGRCACCYYTKFVFDEAADLQVLVAVFIELASEGKPALE